MCEHVCVNSTVLHVSFPHAAQFDSAGGCEALSGGSVSVERQSQAPMEGGRGE